MKESNVETHELLGNDEFDSFLLKGLEKSINQSDLESCDSIGDKSGNDYDLETPIRRIDPVNTPYLVAHKTTRYDEVESKHLYTANANEIEEKKPELKDLPHHLEYAYLHSDKSFLIIISSKLSEKEKMLLFQVLEKHRGAFAWKMSDVKGISLSFCTHKILMEDDFKPVIQPQRRLNPKVQDVVKTSLFDYRLIYPISNSSWVSPIHVVPKKGGMNVVLNDNNELIPSRTVTGWRVFIDYQNLNDVTQKDHFTLPFIDQMRMSFGLCNTPATIQRCMTAIFHDMVEDFMELFMDDFLVFGIEVNRAKIDVIAKLPYPTNVKDHLSRLENPDLGVFTEEEIADEFPDEHLLMLKAKPNDDEPWGHHSALITGRKVYESGFFWPSIFKDARDYIMRCDAFQRSGNISSRSEMPQNNIQCNIDLAAAAKNHFIELNELMKLRDEEYKNTRIYKERTKKWHDSRLRGDKDFKVGDKVLLFNSRLRMHPDKLKSKWYGPNVVKTVYPYGTVEITDKNGIRFKVNGQRLKKYYDGHIDTEDKAVVECNEDMTMCNMDDWEVDRYGNANLGQPKKKKAKKALFTVYLKHDGIFTSWPLKYAQGIREIKSDQDIADMVKVGYDNRNEVDMFVEHFGYDIMEMAEFDRNDEQNNNRIESGDDDYYSSDDCEEIENVDFQTEGDDSVVIKNISTQDPFLTKLCSTRVMFRGTTDATMLQETQTPQVDRDDNQIDSIYKVKKG
ncbi:hypothetical protein Tco_0527105 [Tanacetum coccineum]